MRPFANEEWFSAILPNSNVPLSGMMSISGHGHILYIYENLDRYIQNAVAFVRMGIQQGHQTLIIESVTRYQTIRKLLSRQMDESQLALVHHIDREELYRMDGGFRSGIFMERFSRAVEAYQKHGLLLRTWGNIPLKDVQEISCELDAMEHLADECVDGNGLISVCAYDGRQISAAFQLALLRSHEYHMTDEEFVASSLYLRRSDIYPSLAVQNEHQLDMDRSKQEASLMRSQLLATKHQLESFITRNLDPVLILDDHDLAVSVNQAFETTFGWTKDELVGIPSHAMPLLPDERTFEVRRNKSIIAAGGSIEGYESERVTKAGVRLHVMVSSFPLHDSEDRIRGRAVIIRDITERMQVQELLIRSEKLSIAGELAAGIAHEIRNPVTALKGFLQLLQSGSTEKRDYFYEIMASEIRRIEQILSELLMLAKPQAVHFEAKDIRLLLEDVVTLLNGQAILNDVQIVTSFSDEEMMIMCEENQLKQVCINMIKNAIEAMPRGGSLIIDARMNPSGRGVMVSFIDEGCGIPAHLLERLGQPFYTTKEKGTGLGFMVSKKIVENHGGTVAVHSEENKGTTIVVRLPLDGERTGNDE
ncbi:ATP-binding protein [Paenibacillus sp. D9]|uniref:ATP-binding protein n=1 Tax=Paenibacillus sp. D9 TaxID=665792 RepID=UPI000675EA08|nr:ATP-binding protein [Paenibacillus sp. D9]